LMHDCTTDVKLIFINGNLAHSLTVFPFEFFVTIVIQSVGVSRLLEGAKILLKSSTV